MKIYFAALLAAAALLSAMSVQADVFGRVRVRVLAADEHAAVSGCKVVLRDTADARGDIALTTDRHGIALSPLLEERFWRVVRIVLPGNQPPLQISSDLHVYVAADTTTEVTVVADSPHDRLVHVSVAGAETAIVYRRDQAFLHRYPTGRGDPQSLDRVFQSVPGGRP